MGSHVSLGPGIWPFWGALGAVSSVGERFSLLGTQPTTNHFGHNSAPPGSFGEFCGSSELRSRCATFVQPRLPMVRPPVPLHPSISRKSRFRGFWWVWVLEKIRGQTQNRTGKKKSKKMLDILFFVAVPKKNVFVRYGAILFRSWPLVHPIGAVRTPNT